MKCILKKKYYAVNLIALYNHLRSTDFITPCLVWVYLGKYNKSGACQWLVASGGSFSVDRSWNGVIKSELFLQFAFWYMFNRR